MAEVCGSQRCCHPNHCSLSVQVVTETEVPTRYHSHSCLWASSWATSLYLADQAVPTPEYTVTNHCLFAYSFIFSLACSVVPQAKTFSLWEAAILPWAHCVSSCARRAACFGQCPVGLCLTPPLPVSHPKPSPASHLTILDVLVFLFSSLWNIAALPNATNSLTIFESFLGTRVFCCVFHHYFTSQNFFLTLCLQ